MTYCDKCKEGEHGTAKATPVFLVRWLSHTKEVEAQDAKYEDQQCHQEHHVYEGVFQRVDQCSNQNLK